MTKKMAVIFVCMELFLFIGFISNEDSNEDMCVTWMIRDNNLDIICRLADSSNPVKLVDSFGHVRATCTLKSLSGNCSLYREYDAVKLNSSIKEIMLTIEGFQDKFVNGNWSCLQGKSKVDTFISIEEGILADSQLYISGKYRYTNNTTKIKITCRSCRESRGYHVDIRINGISQDSIRYDPVKSRCMHKNGVCHPNRCFCSRNEFIIIFDKSPNSSFYSCNMGYLDENTGAIFSVTATIYCNGKDCKQNGSTIDVTREPRKEKPIYIAKENNNTGQHKNETKEDGRTCTEKCEIASNGVVFKLVGKVFLGCIPFVVLFGICWFIIKYKYQPAKPDKKKIEQSETLNEESHLLQNTNDANALTGGMVDAFTTTEVCMVDAFTTTKGGMVDAFTTTKDEMKTNHLFNEGQNTSLQVCGPCAVDGTNWEVFNWCMECHEPFCKTCSGYHSSMKRSRSHHIVEIQNVPLCYSALSCLFCSMHQNSDFQYFCLIHEALCCGMCLLDKHRSCEKVQSVNDTAENITKSSFYEDIRSRIERCQTSLAEIENEQHKNRYCVKMYDGKDNDSVQSLVNVKLNTLAAIEKDIEETKKSTISIEEGIQSLDFLEKSGFNIQLFIVAHYLTDIVQKVEKQIESFTVCELTVSKQNNPSFSTVREHKDIQKSVKLDAQVSLNESGIKRVPVQESRKQETQVSSVANNQIQDVKKSTEESGKHEKHIDDFNRIADV